MNELRLLKDIVEEPILEQAIQAYQGISKIMIEEEQRYYIVYFFECIYPVDITKKEFENYIINLTCSYSK